VKSLFARTLLWFLAAALIPALALMISSAITTHNTSGHREPPFGLMISLQLEEARHAYETGGRPELKTTLERFQRITNARAF
jgi:hypothetical protein